MGGINLKPHLMATMLLRLKAADEFSDGYDELVFYFGV